MVSVPHQSIMSPYWSEAYNYCKHRPHRYFFCLPTSFLQRAEIIAKWTRSGPELNLKWLNFLINQSTRIKESSTLSHYSLLIWRVDAFNSKPNLKTTKKNSLGPNLRVANCGANVLCLMYYDLKRLDKRWSQLWKCQRSLTSKKETIREHFEQNCNKEMEPRNQYI